MFTLIGGETYEVLNNVVLSKKPKDVSYENIVQVLTKHLCPQKKIIVERNHFYKKDQKVGESMSDFIIELRRLVSDCQFDSFLNEALRDLWFLQRVQRKELYCKFDAQPTLKFEEACVITCLSEKAEEESNLVTNMNKLRFDS